MTMSDKLRLVMSALSLEETVELGEAIELGAVMRPCLDRILAYPLDEKASEIIEVVSDSKRPRKYLAVAVGPGGFAGWRPHSDSWQGEQEDERPIRLPMPVEPGDVFLAGPYVGERFEYPMRGQEYALVKASDVLAVMDLEAALMRAE